MLRVLVPGDSLPNHARSELTQRSFDTVDNCEQHKIGWGECLDGLDGYIETQLSALSP